MLNNVFFNIGMKVLELTKGINFGAFVENLQYMALGMLGIFVVIGVIIVFTVILARLLKDKPSANNQ